MEFALVSEDEPPLGFTYYDYGVFIATLIISGALGLCSVFRKGPECTVQGIEPMLPRKKQRYPVFVSISLVASFISAPYIVGNAAEIFQNGTMYSFSVLSYCLVVPVTAALYLPVFYRCDVLTCYEYVEKRFNRTLRSCAVSLYTVQTLIYCAIQLYGSATALSDVSGIELWTAVLVISLLSTAYTCVGGMRSTVYAELFQCICAIVAMLVVVVFGIGEVGGFARLWDVAMKGGRIQFDEVSFRPTVRHTVWGLVFGGFFGNLASYVTNHMMVMRYYAVATPARAKLVLLGFLSYLAIMFTLSCLSGLIVYAYFAECDPVIAKQVRSHYELLPYFVVTALRKYTGVAGLFAAGMSAATMSSISSNISALANVIFADVLLLIRRHMPNKHATRVITLLGVAFCIISSLLVYMAQYMGDVVSATDAINTSIGAPLLGLISVGIFVPFVNTRGAATAFVVSLAVSIWLSSRTYFEPSSNFSALPVSLDKCSSKTMAAWGTEKIVLPTLQREIDEEILKFSDISYVWNTAVTLAASFFVAMTVSSMTGAQNPKKLDPDLIAKPFDVFCPWLPRRIRRELALHVGEEFIAEEKWIIEEIKVSDLPAPGLLNISVVPAALTVKQPQHNLPSQDPGQVIFFSR